MLPGESVTLFGGGHPRGIAGLIFVDDGRIGDGLSNGGDTVILIYADGADTLAMWTYPKTRQGVSWTRWQNGTWRFHDRLPGKGTMSPGRATPRLERLLLDPDSLVVSLGDTASMWVNGVFSDGDTLILADGTEIKTGDETVIRVVESRRLVPISEGVARVWACWEDRISEQIIVLVESDSPSAGIAQPGTAGGDTLVFVAQDTSGNGPISGGQDSIVFTAQDTSGNGLAGQDSITSRSGLIPIHPDSVSRAPVKQDSLGSGATGDGLSGFQEGTVTVGEDSTLQKGLGGQGDGQSQGKEEPVNAPPVFTSDPDLIVLTGMAYAYLPQVKDPEGDAVILELSRLPGWLRWEGGRLHGVPGAKDRGSHPMIIVADDGTHQVRQEWTLVIQSPREFLNLPRQSRATAGLTWRLPLRVTESFQIQADGGPEWDRGVSQLVWRPAATGDKTVTVALSRKGAKEQLLPIAISVGPKPRLRVTEILADPPEDLNGDGKVERVSDQMIELLNAGSESVDLSGWSLGDDDGAPYVFPGGMTLAPGQTLRLLADGRADHPEAIYSAGGKIGNGLAGSDRILMIAPFGPDTLLRVHYRGGNIGASLVPDPENPGRWASHNELYGSPFSFSSLPRADQMPVSRPEKDPVQETLDEKRAGFPFPNPFQGTTTLGFHTSGGPVSLTVYSLLGQPIRHLLKGDLSAGYYEQIWDGKDDRRRTVGSGIYLVRVQHQGKDYTHRIVFLR